MPSKCMPSRCRRSAGAALGPSANGWMKNTSSTIDANDERGEREIETLQPQRRERRAARRPAATTSDGEDDREAVAVRAAEPRVRDRADPRERERGERHLTGPAGERHERQRDERGAHSEREAVEVRGREEQR